MLIALDGVRLLTDPVLRDRIGPLIRVARPVRADGLGQLDGVLLSHLHADHADAPSLRRIDPATPVLAPHGAGSWLRGNSIRAVEVSAGETTSVGGLQVTATVARHERRRRPFGPAADPVGYLVAGSRSVYFAGDTDLDPTMAELRGSVDVALLPIWGWGRSVGAGHLDPKRAAAALALIAPAVAIPIHWGTFAPRWSIPPPRELKRPVAEFVALAARHAPDVDVRVLAPGEEVELWP